MSSILNQIGIFFTYRVLKLSILLFEKNLMPDFITRWVSRPDPWSLRECASCNIPRGEDVTNTNICTKKMLDPGTVFFGLYSSTHSPHRHR